MFIRKSLKFIFLILAIITVVSCGAKTSDLSTTDSLYLIPDFSNKTQSEISTILDDEGLNYVFQLETSNEVEENKFLRFGNNLSVGDKVDFDTEIIVFIATEDLILPGLEGKNQLEIISILRSLDRRQGYQIS